MKQLNWQRESLWEGCILASIAHAIMVAHYPEFSNEQSWDDINYNIQDSSGARGTITFHPNYLVGAFRNELSEREYINAQDYLNCAPGEVHQLAVSETLQYLLDEIDGDPVPVITTAFWESEDGTYSNDSFKDFIENGGFLIETQAQDIETAINVWKEYYEMSDSQIILLRYIFQRIISNPNGEIILTESEIKMIESDVEEGLNESRISFEELGIEWEK